MGDVELGTLGSKTDETDEIEATADGHDDTTGSSTRSVHGWPNVTPAHDSLATVSAHTSSTHDPISIATHYIRVVRVATTPYIRVGTGFVCTHVAAILHGGVLIAFGTLGVIMAHKIQALERDIDYIIDHGMP